MPRQYSVDTRCHELAEVFLSELPHTEEETRVLAQTIQDTIEDWLTDLEYKRTH